MDSQTDGMYIISQADKNRYPVGFQYLLGNIVYTVQEDVTKDTGSEMRRVVASDGNTQIMTLESIDLDLREVDAKVIDDGATKKEATKEEDIKQHKDTEEDDEYKDIEW